MALAGRNDQGEILMGSGVWMLAAVVAVVFSLVISRHPRFGFGLFVAVMVAVPVWVEVHALDATMVPLTFVFAFLIPTIFRNARGSLATVDILLVIFLALSVVAVYFSGSPRYAVAEIMVQWLPAYAVGRGLSAVLTAASIYRTMAVAGVVAGVWAVAEFVFGLHLFEQFSGTPGAYSWQEIQLRGTLERSEAAFGHSIALGAFLSLTAPFVIASSFSPRVRVVMLAILTAGTIVTFSRGAMIGLALATVITLWRMKSGEIARPFRRKLQVATVLALGVLMPFVYGLFAGVETELGQSTQYRVGLTENIFADMVPIGQANEIQIDQAGLYHYRGLRSIDNEYILAVLQFGWVPVLLLIAGLALAAKKVLQGRGNAADVALTAQIVVLATVALITQYTMAVWLVAGIAAGLSSMKLKDESPEPSPIRGSELSHR